MARQRHTVLFVPGFLVGDASNLPLAAVVKRAGCKPARSLLGTNSGPTTRVIEHLNRRVEELSDERGEITLVGVSLGGVLARRLARTYPDRVRQVISIGSPFRFSTDESPNHIVARLWKARLDGFDPEALEEIETDEDLKPPLRVPSTSIFSRMDGIVPFKRTLVSASAHSENIEAKYSGHIALVVHPGVHLVLKDRVRQPAGEWRPFRVPLTARALVKTADYFDPARAG